MRCRTIWADFCFIRHFLLFVLSNHLSHYAIRTLENNNKIFHWWYDLYWTDHRPCAAALRRVRVVFRGEAPLIHHLGSIQTTSPVSSTAAVATTSTSSIIVFRPGHVDFDLLTKDRGPVHLAGGVSGLLGTVVRHKGVATMSSKFNRIIGKLSFYYPFPVL